MFPSRQGDGSADAADGVAGPVLQGLLAVAELADQALAAIAQGRDIGVSWFVGRPDSSGEDVELAQHRSGVAQQRRCPLDLLRCPDRIARRHRAPSAVSLRPIAVRRLTYQLYTLSADIDPLP